MLATRSANRLVRSGFFTFAFLWLVVPPARADLLLFYNFNDDSDPLVAIDESGNGNDGTINGNDFDGDLVPDTPALYTDDGLGHTGLEGDRALDFLTTAEGTWVNVENAVGGAFQTLTDNDAATITMWLFGADNQPVNQWNFWFGPGRQLGSHIPWSDGTIYFDVAGCCGGNQRININEPDPTKYKGEWNHYAFVKEGEFTRIFQNGVMLLEGAGKSPLGTISEVYFGAGDSNHTSSYNGLMDDIGVWDEALDEEAIQLVMESGVGPPKPIAIRRDIPDSLINGTSGLITITVTPRAPGSVVVINEKIPAGLTASNPSNGGVLAGDTITWNLGAVNDVTMLTYTLAAAGDAANAKFPSTATADGNPINIGGDTFYNGAPITALGFIRLWQHLGPFAFKNPPNAVHGPPGACDTTDPVTLLPELASDWIANEDGSVTEANVMPFRGMLIRPKYGGTGTGGDGARAAGLVIEPGDFGDVVTDRFPVWHGGLAAGDTIDHASPQVYGVDMQDHVTLSSVYVTNHTGAAIDTNIGVGSDDAIQIFINDVDVTAGGMIVCRGWGAANEEQNVFPATLPDGESRILVKVSDGVGASGFRLRFQDPLADPTDPRAPGLVSPAITVSLESASSPRPGTVTRTLSKTEVGLDDTVDVSLAINLNPAANVLLREVLPTAATATAISDGGVLTGNVIEWDLPSTGQKTVTYTLGVTPCAFDLTLNQSTFKVGSAEVLVEGASSINWVHTNDDLGPSWQNKDIGGDFGGLAEKLGDHDVLLSGAGAGVRSTKDEFHFVSTPASGDFKITARIDCFDDPGTDGVAGVMVRASDDPSSATIFLSLSSIQPTGGGAGTLKGFWRRDAGKSGSSIVISNAPDRAVAALPIYLQLSRAADVISLQRSDDGTTFTTVATRNVLLPADPPTNTTKIVLGNDVVVGLAATSASAEFMRARFSNVSGPAFDDGPPTKSFRRGDVDANGLIDISDPVGLLGALFLGTGDPACLDAADFDDNGTVDITDAVNNLGYQFLGTAPPAAPGTTCGPDPTAETPDLGCTTSC